MMKIHLYIAMLWVISLLAGCNDVTVGYLYTTEASYSMDTLQVTRFSALEDNINELERVFEKYTPEIQNLLAETDQLEKEFVSLSSKRDELYEAYKRARTAWLNAPASDKEYYQELLNKATEEYTYWKDEVVAPAERKIRSQKNTISSMCGNIGLADPYTLREQISQLQEQIDKNIPWTTAQIEQVLGTEPLHYSLYRVKSSNGQEAADDFAKYMTVIGGGRMYVDAKVDSPVGYYTVSLKIENEGHTATLEDIFTFEVRDN